MTDECNGLVHLYYGPGKGKTTAAIGAALRAVGHDWSVALVQFLKGSAVLGQPYGEIDPLTSHETVTHNQFALDRHISAADTLTEDERATVESGLETLAAHLRDPAIDLVVADELALLWAFDIVDADRLLDALEGRHPATEVIVTGRQAPAALIDAAAYVTHMGAIKHPFETGTDAREGVEY